MLVIGYGNQMRGDDGIGPRVAEAIAAANYPGVQVRKVFQLLPELAADQAEATAVVFVDAIAASGSDDVELISLSAEQVSDWSTHCADPRALLALTQALYGRTPEAWWLTVPVREFDFGEGLSAVAQQNSQQAIARLDHLVQARKKALEASFERQRPEE